MKNYPMVGIIIPTYNGLPFLKDAVESVLGQSYKNFELYIIDDGSTDQTKGYIKTLTDKRVHYFYKKNGGLSSTRNYGIRNSKSELIAFLDADDLWYPKKLEKQVKLIEKNPSLGLVYGHHDIIDEFGKKIGKLVIEKRGRIFDDLLAGNRIAGSGSMVIVRRSVFEECGVFREDFLIGEDWEMWLRIANKYEIDFVPEILVAIRVHGGGMQQNFAKMGRGLRYMLPVMLGEFDLNFFQKQKLIAACLIEAADDFYRLKDYKTSREILAELFRRSPLALFYPRRWVLYFFMILGADREKARRIKHFISKVTGHDEGITSHP